MPLTYSRECPPSNKYKTICGSIQSYVFNIFYCIIIDWTGITTPMTTHHFHTQTPTYHRRRTELAI